MIYYDTFAHALSAERAWVPWRGAIDRHRSRNARSWRRKTQEYIHIYIYIYTYIIFNYLNIS